MPAEDEKDFGRKCGWVRGTHPIREGSLCRFQVLHDISIDLSLSLSLFLIYIYLSEEIYRTGFCAQRYSLPLFIFFISFLFFPFFSFLFLFPQLLLSQEDGGRVFRIGVMVGELRPDGYCIGL